MQEQKQNLTDTIRRELSEEILSGELPSGAQIDEQLLVRRFGVSRTPAREALLQLAATGLVTLIPRQGAVVSSISLRAYVGLNEVLTSLEALAAGLAARRITNEETAVLRESYEECSAAALQNDAAAYRAANTRFHTAIYNACHNDYLNQQLRTLRARMRGIIDIRFDRPARIRASLQEHRDILDAILAGDEEAAAKAMTNHISAGANNFADMLAAFPNEQSSITGTAL
ncbi:GntR family transcriptional regulator [Burkholderia cenocepacia]|uniref:GntR family transcriptional regulator n=1 Tax=Burkholderia cenocepacia TaxID=95486 RepID=UPI002AB31AB0|nr:GntR family transcriptional regulator [Burkholderia cenocepacia]